MWVIIVVILVILGVGVGAGIWAMNATKSKTIGYYARVWTLGKEKTKSGKASLIPYGKDFIIKRQVAINVSRYKLQRLDIEVPPVTPEFIKNFEGEKTVNVLYHNGRATLMDVEAGFEDGKVTEHLTPIDFDTFTFAEFQKNNRLRRLENNSNPFETVMRWIGSIIQALAFIAAIFFMVQGLVEVSENNKNGSEAIAGAINDFSERLAAVEGVVTDVGKATGNLNGDNIVKNTEVIKSIT